MSVEVVMHSEQSATVTLK